MFSTIPPKLPTSTVVSIGLTRLEASVSAISDVLKVVDEEEAIACSIADAGAGSATLGSLISRPSSIPWDSSLETAVTTRPIASCTGSI